MKVTIVFCAGLWYNKGFASPPADGAEKNPVPAEPPARDAGSLRRAERKKKGRSRALLPPPFAELTVLWDPPARTPVFPRSRSSGLTSNSGSAVFFGVRLSVHDPFFRRRTLFRFDPPFYFEKNANSLSP